MTIFLFLYFFFQNHSIFKKLFNFCIILAFIVFVFNIFLPFKDSFVLIGESLFMQYLSLCPFIPQDSIFQVFVSNDHLWLIYSVFHVLFNKEIPMLLNIHPQTIFPYIAISVIIPILFLMITVLGQSFYKYFIVKNYNPLFPFFIFTSLFAILIQTGFLWVFHYDCWYYAYIFIPIFALCCYNMAEKIYVQNEKLSKRTIISFSIIVFFTCVSHEFFRIIFMSALLIGYILDKIVFKYIPPRKKLAKDIFIYFVLILINSITWFLGEKECFSECIINNNFYEKIFVIFSHCKDLNNFLFDNIWFFIILIITCILISKFVKNKIENKKLFICIFSSCLSVFLFFILMISVVENTEISGWIILEHRGLLFLSKLFLFNLILSTSGYLIANTKIKKQKFLFTITIIFISCFMMHHFQIFSTINNLFSYMKSTKKMLYVWEKAFFIKNNNKAENFILYRPTSPDIFDLANKEMYKYYLLNGNDLEQINCKFIDVCKDSKTTEDCTKELIDILYKSTGYKFTKQELENPNFDDIYKN